MIACSAPSALRYAILAVSPQSVIPSGAKFESRTSYLRSMRILVGQEVQRFRRCFIFCEYRISQNFAALLNVNPFESSEPKEVAAHSSLIVRGRRHLARSGGNAQKEIPYGISFLFYISYNKGREEAVRDGYRRYISGREERSL